MKALIIIATLLAPSLAVADGFGYQDGQPAYPNSGFGYQEAPDWTPPPPPSPFGPLFDNSDDD
jgi:hypothetical protein